MPVYHVCICLSLEPAVSGRLRVAAHQQRRPADSRTGRAALAGDADGRGKVLSASCVVPPMAFELAEHIWPCPAEQYLVVSPSSPACRSDHMVT